MPEDARRRWSTPLMCPHFSINQFRVAYSFLPGIPRLTTALSSIVAQPPGVAGWSEEELP